MVRRLTLTTLAFLFLSSFATAQTVMNFDKTVGLGLGEDIVIQPPPGKTWTLLRGSFIVRETIQSAGVTIYEQFGEEPGLCTNLIRADLSSQSWIPIVGGFVAHPHFGYLKGQDVPIVLPYPNRLVIHVEGLQRETRTWTRFTIQESDLGVNVQQQLTAVPAVPAVVDDLDPLH